jgi:hypothetical protein
VCGVCPRRAAFGQPPGADTPEARISSLSIGRPAGAALPEMYLGSHERGCPSVKPETNWTVVRHGRMVPAPIMRRSTCRAVWESFVRVPVRFRSTR